MDKLNAIEEIIAYLIWKGSYNHLVHEAAGR